MRSVPFRLRLTLSVSALAFVALLPGTTPAAVFVWNGGTNLYSSPAAWLPAGVPGASDDAQILAPGSVAQVFGVNAAAGVLELGSGNLLQINNSNFSIGQNAVTNDGTISIANASRFLSGSGVVNVSGTGVIALDDSVNYAQLYAGGFVFGSGQTVRGSGNLGENQTVFSNSGLVSADVNGRTLDIDPSGGNGGVGASGFGTNGAAGFYNTGTMQATGGGTLALEGGLYENSATGVIRALNNSTVSLNGDSRVVGGSLTTVGTGLISANGTVQYLQSVTLTNGSNLRVNGDDLHVNTGITNNGTITVINAARVVSETGAVNYGGNGTIILDNTNNYAQIYGGAITFGSGQVLRGSGQLGINQTVITNNGLISADAGTGMDLDPAGGNGGVGAGAGVGTNLNSSLLNNGVMQANGNVLSLEGGLYENGAGGVIRAINGGTVSLNGDSRLLNGVLSSDATSQINAINTVQYLQNVTLSAGTKVNVTNDDLHINTGIINNGTITVSAGARLVSETPTVNYSGTGTIILNDISNYAQLYGGSVVLGANQIVRGSGQIGINQTLITNNGLISADVNGRTIDVDPSGGNGGVAGGLGVSGAAGLLNNATMQATNGSNLQLEGGYYDNNAGLIRAINGSTVTLASDSRTVGGTLSSDATSRINAINVSQYLQGVTLSSGSKIGVTNDNLYINTGIVNNGTITVSAGSRLISETATANYNGSGTIVLDDSGNYAQLYGGSVVLGASQIVRGSGQIGINQTLITNNGLISADVSGRTIDLDPSGGNGGVGGGLGVSGTAGLLNNATMQATNSSNLQFEGGYYDNNAGLIRAINGSTVTLASDSRIVGGTLSSDATSQINASNVSQYLQGVTLSSGGKIIVTNDNLYINTGITNNGTISVSAGSRLVSETGTVTYGGSGTIVLDDSGNYALLYGNSVVLGANQTVRGSGQIGINQTVITNNGLISGDVSGRNLLIDPSGGNGGVGAGAGVGTNGNSAFYNTGTVQSANGGATILEGGLYENSATGTFAALTGSTTTMGSDSSLYNLQAGGVLNQGNYTSATTGAASVLDLQSNAANSIVQIGTGAATTDTVVTLSGANSQLGVYAFNQGAITSIDSSLTTVAHSGELIIENGRTFTATGAGGAFTNAGIVKLAAGTFGATSYANSGLTTGSGTVAVDIANTGTVEANGGTLATQAILGGGGTIRTLAGSTLDLSAATADSTAGTLTNNGSLVLGSHNVTVTSDYTNANFGSGNAFNRRANVSGSGDIYGVNYTVDLSGPAVSGNTINVGNVRTGGSSSTTLTITNNGTTTNIVGAVQNTNAPDIALSQQDFTAAHGGGSATTTLSYTGTHAGSLAGESITVVNNFANVGPKTLQVQGNVYQIAVAGSQPNSISLGASRVGDAAQSSTLTIANVAPNTPGFTEALTSTASTTSPFKVNGGNSATVSNIAAGGSAPITVSLGTGTAGAFNNTVAISNTSIPVAGSGFSNLALAGQSVSVNGNVYAPAVASLSSNTVAFGPVRQGAASPTQNLTLTNASVGALSDSLITSAGTLPAGVTGTTPGALAQGQQGTVGFTLSTATAGQVNGSGSLNFTSHDGQLSDLTLAPQTVNFTGTVTQLAQALITKNAGVGTLAGSGATYTLDLGSFASGSGVESSTLGVTNNIPNSSFAEFLNGAFTASPAQNFSFNGQSFTGLAGGSNSGGDVLSFNTNGDQAGTYTEVLTFNGYSSYPGESNYNLGPVTVDVTVHITGGVSGVPEPAAWAMMLVGFGLIGGMMRRQRSGSAIRQRFA